MLVVLAEAALRTALLAGIVQAGLWLLRVRQAQLLLTVWTVVLGASFAMPVLIQLEPFHVSVEPAFPIAFIGGAKDLLEGASAGVSSSLQARAQPSIGHALEATYAAGALVIAFRLLVGLALSIRFLKRSVPFRPDWAGSSRLRMSPDIRSPVTIGVVILLPTDVADWHVKTREAVLAHERAHVARNDFALLILSQLNRAVFWFSPLSWWLHRKLVNLTELASDDQAIATTRDRLGYADVLLEMGRRPRPASRELAMARQGTLHRRIDRILRHQAMPSPADPRQQALFFAGTACLSAMAAFLAPSSITVPLTAPLSQLVPQTSDVIQSTSTDASTSESRLADTRDDVSPDPPALVTAVRAGPEQPSPKARALSESSSGAGVQGRHPVDRLPRVTALESSTRNRSAPLHVKRTAQPASIQSRLPPSPSLEESVAQVMEPKLLKVESVQTSNDPPASGSMRSTFEQVMNNDCAGAIWAGRTIRQVTPQQAPGMVAGEPAPAHAFFFRNLDGSPWVRFSAFGRPPLDVPVGVSATGLTWAGEYGITYGAQVLGSDRLAGIAVAFGRDSTRLELKCTR